MKMLFLENNMLIIAIDTASKFEIFDIYGSLKKDESVCTSNRF